MRKFQCSFIVACLLFICSSVALAQECSQDSQNATTACAASAAAGCATAYGCNANQSALTVDDVEVFARERCCDKSKKVARKVCLLLYKQKFTPSSGGQRPFMLAARERISQLRSSDCGTVGYTALF